jgi:hypothetical protein
MPRPLGVGQAIAESISCLLPEMAVAMPKILHLSIFGIYICYLYGCVSFWRAEKLAALFLGRGKVCEGFDRLRALGFYLRGCDRAPIFATIGKENSTSFHLHPL